MTDIYKMAYLMVTALGPGALSANPPPSDHEAFYMRMYWLKNNTIRLNELSEVSYFNWFFHKGKLCLTKKLAEFTSQFNGRAWPFHSQSINGKLIEDSANPGFEVGFIFEDPNDALIFKLAAPYEIRITDLPAENVIG